MVFKSWNRAALSVFFCLGAASVSVPAAAGTKDDVRALQARMDRAEQALSAQSAATVRINELERQIQILTGRIEELNYQLDQQNQRLDSVSAALAGDMLGAGMSDDFESGTGDAPGVGMNPAPAGRGAGAPGGPVNLAPGGALGDTPPMDTPETGAARGGASPASVELPLNPDAAFDYASGYLLGGDYQRAKSAFQLYTEAFPNHTRTADAKFRLGEIHLALGENADAADVFLDHIQSYPNDGRAAESYLKLGTAFARMDKPTEACSVFRTMKTKYPGAAAPVVQRADIEMARINCN